MIEKADLRRQMRTRRRALGGVRQRQAAMHLRDRLMRHPLFMASRRIAFYVAADGEINPWPAMQFAATAGRDCYLPVLAPPPRTRVLFGHVTRDTRLVPNHFGIPEPDQPAVRLHRAHELDLVLLPLVAFDAYGHRIGMGGGFYDRTLAFLGTRHHWYQPRLLGLAHELQRVQAIDADSWDVPLEGIVTDEGVYAATTATSGE